MRSKCTSGAVSKISVADHGQSVSASSGHGFFKLSYKPRICRSKAAVVTMIWNFSALIVFFHYLRPQPQQQFIFKRYDVVFGGVFLLYPVFGWLADAHFGRYRFMRLSIYVLWICGIFYVVIEILKNSNLLEKGHINLIGIIFLAALMVSFGAYQVNAIIFGVDQLIDSSSQDISSYISWYVWMFFLCDVIVSFSQLCTCREYISVSSLLMPVVLTLSVCADILFGRWLVKEPVTFNPLKLIFNVSRYTLRNKYPRQTYSDDKPFSRINVGKSKYGGPFTTEEVEDVKTFFRILILMFMGSFFSGIVFITNQTVSNNMVFHFQDQNYNYSHICTDSSSFSVYLRDCFERTAVNIAGSISMVVVIPLFEIILYPLLRKCIPRLSMMRRFILGMILNFCFQLSLILLEIVGHSLTQQHSHRDSRNITCLLSAGNGPYMEEKSVSLSYRWIALTMLLSAPSQYFLITSCMEFLCAQSPYSMKGVLGGIAYGVGGISILLSSALSVSFKLLTENHLHGIVFGCGVWYYTLVSMLTLFLIIIAFVLNKWYTNRTRDEELHNKPLIVTIAHA